MANKASSKALPIDIIKIDEGIVSARSKIGLDSSSAVRTKLNFINRKEVILKLVSQLQLEVSRDLFCSN
jgi:aspartate carbamoyltransferase regulatory subunit